MNTFQITEPVLEGYIKTMMTEERINTLVAQANEQIDEMATNIAYLEKVKKSQLVGFDYLAQYQSNGLEEVDQFAFTNGFLYV